MLHAQRRPWNNLARETALLEGVSGLRAAAILNPIGQEDDRGIRRGHLRQVFGLSRVSGKSMHPPMDQATNGS
jgi:hypothetical protein